MNAPASMSLYPRAATSRVTTGLGDTPVVMINGPRQCGKTTLVRSLSTTGRPYLTLDDATTLASARTHPPGFLRDLDTVTIDELQRATDPLAAIKPSVDAEPPPGRLLTTRPANVPTLHPATANL